MADFKKLNLRFYERDASCVAEQLLGKRLVRWSPRHQALLSGFIVETEAYLGAPDPASHARSGLRSARNESMYLSGGHCYVYFIYGLHWCFNVVTGARNLPEAVLIRAVEPEWGVDLMRKNRAKPPHFSPRDLARGPARLCEAFEIGGPENGLLLTGDQVFLAEGKTFEDREIDVVPRVGIDYAGDAAEWPLRFIIKDSPYISGRVRPSET